MTPRTRLGFSPAYARLAAATALGLIGALVVLFGTGPLAFSAAPASPAIGCSPTVVTSAADGGAGSLREKVASVGSGGIVAFCPTLANATITLTTQIVVTQTDITIDGAGAPGVSVNGNYATRILTTTDTIGSLTVKNITLTQGVASPANDYDGGALNVRGALVLSNTTLLLNSAKGSGGGAYVTGTLTLTDTQFLSNTSVASLGGGAYSDGAAMLSGGLFQNNSDHTGSGGGIYANSILVLTGTRFINNTADGDGGGAFANGAAVLNAGWFQDNQSTSGLGGGLRAVTIVLTDTKFVSNTANDYGGGAFAAGIVTMHGGLFQDNRCTGVNCRGGGLYATSSLRLTGTQFLDNAAAAGGAIFQFYPLIGSNRLVNLLFARNVATNLTGAALYLGSGGSVQILYSTIASPTLASGSAIYIGAGTVGITDTLVASYSIGISNTGGAVYADYNLFFGDTISRTGTIGSGGHDVVGDPAFANPAADNYHLRAGSAAIDKGVNAGVTIDVDGDHRPIGAGFDIGYDEALLRLFLPLILR